MKYLYVEFPNSEVYRVPASIVAQHRAEYYAELDSNRFEDKTYDEVFDKEVEYTLEDELELRDWAANNMDWSDLADEAERVETEDLSLEEMWRDAELSVKEEPE